MIQRIQTIYLMTAAAIISLLFFLPFAEIASKDGLIYHFDMSGIIQTETTIQNSIQKVLPLLILSSINLILIILIISQYKKRVLQMRLSTLSIFLLLGLTCLIGFYLWQNIGVLEGTFSLKGVITSPVISAILVYLAKRGIAKDEHLIRSIDRIR